ncbi:MAG: hypothetical protein Q8P89_00205, partial [bacterium]|nr:hypothetical protein [bacterium]
YVVFHHGANLRKYFGIFILPVLIAIGIHFYWLLPTILIKKSVLPTGFGDAGWVDFLSFASFSNSISLLHPNWPDNIFGKVGFMRPEFLVVPILVYISLLFIKNYKSEILNPKQTQNSKLKNQHNLAIEQFKNRNILFFALLGLIGAFLAKGSNPPFGEVYLWLFNNFPGMSGFRDPTKFYTIVALSYSVLIPFSLEQISTRVSSIKYKVLREKIKIPDTYFLILTSFLIYWLFLIWPAWMGQLGGTFKTHNIPKEYVQLKEFIASQPEFFRTLWVPQKQRFGFFSNNHPALFAQHLVSPTVCQPPLCSIVNQSVKPENFDPLVKSEVEILDKVREYSLSYFKHPEASKVLSQMAVKYIVVPYDSEGEIFLQDRKYSREEREKYIKFLSGIPWLKKIDSCCFNDLNHDSTIAIYQLPTHVDHFFISDEKTPDLRWRMINPTKYQVGVENATQPFNLVFSETYDSLWRVKINNEIIPSEKIYDGLNSFHIDHKGDLSLIVEFSAQKYVYLGGLISLLTLTTSVFLLLFKKR